MSDPKQSDSQSIIAELHQAMAGKIFPTPESAQAFVDAFMAKKNNSPSDDFCGLSPQQMQDMLYAPFDGPEWVTIRQRVPLSACKDSPLIALFLMLVDALGPDGLKPTAKGNLPRAACRELAEAYRGQFSHADRLYFGPISTELDFIELHVVRVTAQMAGLVRRYKGRLVVTKKCRELLQRDGGEQLYPVLLTAYVRDFNWAYWDRFPSLPFVQHAFLFTVYLLKRFGNEYRLAGFYSDAFLKAFPAVLDELSAHALPYGDCVTEFENLYEWRCLRRFAEFSGLARFRFDEIANPQGFRRHDISILATPLLDAAFDFHV